MNPSPQSDPQREEVYKWESARDANLRETAQPLASMREMRNRIAKIFGVPTPPLIITTDPHLQFAGIANEQRIALNTYHGGRNARTLCHEMAHWITFHAAPGAEPHGRFWLGVYLYLLHRFRVEPLCASMPSARAAGLEFRHPRWCTPEIIKRKMK